MKMYLNSPVGVAVFGILKWNFAPATGRTQKRNLREILPSIICAVKLFNVSLLEVKPKVEHASDENEFKEKSDKSARSRQLIKFACVGKSYRFVSEKKSEQKVVAGSDAKHNEWCVWKATERIISRLLATAYKVRRLVIELCELKWENLEILLNYFQEHCECCWLSIRLEKTRRIGGKRICISHSR